MTKSFFILIFLGHILFAAAQKRDHAPVIFDTDMGPDYDDVGAITLLHCFADSGYIKILATVASTHYEGVAGVLNVLNTYFKRPDLPIGIAKKGLTLRDWQHWSDTLLAKYPHHIRSNEEVPDAVEIYRKLLALQPNHSVTIITVGFFTNLSNLLKSAPDKYSSLNGRQLVQKKVKLLVSMAGKYPNGKEFNVEKDKEASQFVFTHWSTPVIFSGFEIGQKIKVGLQLVNNKKINHSPVKDVFRIAIPMAKEDSAGRMSWDETAVFVAAKGYQPYYTLHKGKIEVLNDGENQWNDKEGNQAYLVENTQPGEMKKIIDHLIMYQPAKQKRL